VTRDQFQQWEAIGRTGTIYYFLISLGYIALFVAGMATVIYVMANFPGHGPVPPVGSAGLVALIIYFVFPYRLQQRNRRTREERYQQKTKFLKQFDDLKPENVRTPDFIFSSPQMTYGYEIHILMPEGVSDELQYETFRKSG
jgi:hypothetical protein